MRRSKEEEEVRWEGVLARAKATEGTGVGETLRKSLSHGLRKRGSSCGPKDFNLQINALRRTSSVQLCGVKTITVHTARVLTHKK